MALSNDLISQFVKVTRDDNTPQKETTVLGTIVVQGNTTYVQFDGSDLLTPFDKTTDVRDGERVTVLVKNHSAIINGNISSPAARTADLVAFANVGNNLSLDTLTALTGKIDNLQAGTLTAEQVEIVNAYIETIRSRYADIEHLSAEDISARDADIETLRATIATFDSITADDLEAINADIDNLKAYNASFTYAAVERLTANDATIKNLDATYARIESLDANYANIDFANIGEAAVRKLFTDSGLINQLVVSDGTITGELVGVTIRGDRIIGNTIVADKLVIRGDDGIFYKLNTDGLKPEDITTLESSGIPTDSLKNNLHGSVIIANTITAEKINVDDLVAFNATIGGYHIADHALYSGVKSTVNNTTRGIYLDDDGQINIGDSTNYLKFYKDENDQYKLLISADEMRFGSSNRSVSEAITEAEQSIQPIVDAFDSGELKGEDAITLRISSSRGNLFKSNSASTVLSVTIYKGSEQIVNQSQLNSVLGAGYHLQWHYQHIDDDSFGTILSTDPMLSNNGFNLTITPDDVDTKIDFKCELINT